ncbi:Scr1 family TA system antitoxin-like transcriptional regulator [Nocardia sp. R6R-6]|uniref:Scr1 family TA system antitoxin-like transcriptional regulator n=1 Tax=Nocardia sp. R6R-6 TaxID=3459303 RepID=UPI00403E15A0
MVGTKSDLSGTTLQHRQLGRALRDARQARGYTLERVAEALEFSRSTLSRLELGQNEKVKVRDVDYICQFYGLPEDRIEYLKLLVTQSSARVWWEDFQSLIRPGFNTYLQLESAATELHFFQSLVIPGLLQTPDYARSVGAAASTGTGDEADQLVERRIQRSAILTRRHKPIQAEFLLHESVLRTVVGSGRVMSSQYRHLADMGTRDNVSIRVVPFTAGFPGGLAIPPYIIIEFPHNEPSVVYTEGAIGTMIFEDGDDVNRFWEIHAAISGAALEERPSRDLLRNIARRQEQ